MTNTDYEYPALTTITAEQIVLLADRLFIQGTSSMTTCCSIDRRDFVLASRVIRRLLSAYERASGSELHSLLVPDQVDLPEVSRASHHSG